MKNISEEAYSRVYEAIDDYTRKIETSPGK